MSGGETMKQAVVTGFVELHNLLCSKYRGNYQWLFRGQANSEWCLLPKAGRQEFVNYQDLDTFRAWCRRAVAFIDLPTNEWNRLAIAQHYGLATRLLDWTVNPLVAAYFAVSGTSESDSCIYCLNISKTKQIDPDEDKIGKVDKVARFKPSAYVGRIIGQWSMFTYHPKPREILNESTTDMKLEKIIVPVKNREELLFDLNFYGFNEATLFPDVEGLSRHVNWWSSNENWKKDITFS